jgi:hypothetical protein
LVPIQYADRHPPEARGDGDLQHHTLARAEPQVAVAADLQGIVEQPDPAKHEHRSETEE